MAERIQGKTVKDWLFVLARTNRIWTLFMFSKNWRQKRMAFIHNRLWKSIIVCTDRPQSSG